MALSGEWDVLLVLGGECPLQRPRSRMAARLYRERLSAGCGQPPARIIVSGGKANARGGQTEAQQMGLFLEQLGVPRQSMVLETQATNTHENIVLGGQLIQQLGSTRRVGLVSDNFHLRRCHWLFRKAFPDWPEPLLYASGYQGSWAHRLHEGLSLTWWKTAGLPWHTPLR